MDVQPVIATKIELPNERLAALPTYVGKAFMAFEGTVFTLADRFVPSYKGGYWDFYKLSNGGFFIAPTGISDAPIRVVSAMNFYEGKLSAEAIGVGLSLIALSLVGQCEAATKTFEALYQFVLDHPERGELLKLLD